MNCFTAKNTAEPVPSRETPRVIVRRVATNISNCFVEKKKEKEKKEKNTSNTDAIIVHDEFVRNTVRIRVLTVCTNPSKKRKNVSF